LAGYPKAVPQALAERMERAHAAGDPFRVKVLTGASIAPELDGALAKVDGMELRMPYQPDPEVRSRINAGRLEYIDIHLSHVAQHTWFGFFGDIDVALVEVSAINEDGTLVPSSSVGNNKTWLELADRVILEVNRWQPAALDGMHDIYYGTALPPDRQPIPLVRADQRIGEPHLRVDPAKVVAVVETDAPDRNSAFSPPDESSRRIAGHLLEFLAHERRKGRLGERLLRDGVLRMASATSFSLSPDGIAEFNDNVDFYRERILLRPQEISNHPDYRPMLEDYFERASAEGFGRHTPHLLGEALSWHQRLIETGSMRR